MNDEYIDAAGEQIAASICRGFAVEIAYQPDENTFLGLVFTPMWNIVTSGIGEHEIMNAAPGFLYEWGTALVSIVDGMSHPMSFVEDEDRPEIEVKDVVHAWIVNSDHAYYLHQLFLSITANMELP